MKVESSSRFLKALSLQDNDRPPVWFMRQAGRYLPEYRELRAKYSFMEMCRNPEIAAEITLQPLRRFSLDAAIIFSDILVIPDAMGMGLEFSEGRGPWFRKEIRDIHDIYSYFAINPEQSLEYVAQAIKLVASQLPEKTALIGFSGSPWTLACYMLEGGSSSLFNRVKYFAYSESAAMDYLLDILSKSVAEYLAMQAAAGAEALMVFDTWGGILGSPYYQKYTVSSLVKVIKILRQILGENMPPVLLYAKGVAHYFNELVSIGYSGLGVDFTVDIAKVCEKFKGKIAIQGNLDPSFLYAPDEILRNEVLRILNNCSHYPGYIFNLGHGVQPGVSPNKISLIVDTIENYHNSVAGGIK